MSSVEFDTSVRSLINEAFDECECVSRNHGVEHAGARRAYLVKHCPCRIAGFLCEAHFQARMAVPSIGRNEECAHCGHVMPGGELDSVYPL